MDSVTPHLVKILEYGYWDYFSELHDEPAGWTVTVTTDRRGHDGPSWTPSSHTYEISSTALFITLDGKYDGPS